MQRQLFEACGRERQGSLQLVWAKSVKGHSAEVAYKKTMWVEAASGGAPSPVWYPSAYRFSFELHSWTRTKTSVQKRVFSAP